MAELNYGTEEAPVNEKMNKQEYHYEKAEILLEKAEDEIRSYENSFEGDQLQVANLYTAMAQAHATLATIINKEPMEQ